MTDNVVLDSSAVLAALLLERGGDVVEPLLTRAAISCVSLTEIIAKMQDRKLSQDEIQLAAGFLGRCAHPLSIDQSIAAGNLRHSTRHLGLSLGDRCCLALAQDLGAKVLTTDRTWASLDIGVEIEVIR